MNLNDEDIRRSLKRYFESSGKRGYEMAEICGMSSASMFSQYMSGTTKTLRAEYLLNFLLNTGLSLHEFLDKNIESSKNENTTTNISAEEEQESKKQHPEQKKFTCNECVSKQKEIDALKKALEAKEELLEMYRDRNKKDQGKCG